MKVLYVEMVNNWAKFCTDEMGSKGVVSSRIVKIPLTSEQEKLIEPRTVVTSGNREIYEEMRILTIQDEEVKDEKS